MKTESIQELVDLCRAGQCAISLEGCTTGVVAKIQATRAKVSRITSVFLDANDLKMGGKLQQAVESVQ